MISNPILTDWSITSLYISDDIYLLYMYIIIILQVLYYNHIERVDLITYV